MMTLRMMKSKVFLIQEWISSNKYQRKSQELQEKLNNIKQSRNKTVTNTNTEDEEDTEKKWNNFKELKWVKTDFDDLKTTFPQNDYQNLEAIVVLSEFNNDPLRFSWI